MSDELHQDDVTPPTPDGTTPTVPNVGANVGDSELPIPVTPRTDLRALADRKRMRHRRKRYTLFLMRNNRRRQHAHAGARARGIWMSVMVLIALILTLVSVTAAEAVGYYNSQADTLDALQHQVASSDSVRIFDMHGTLLYEINTYGAKHSICYSQMPQNIRDATIAIENKDFLTDNGIDFQRIIAAALANYQHGSVSQGASTITQQLIKNTVLDSKTTIDRKIKEAILAFGITETHRYSKQQILTMYLNEIPYGPTVNGLDAAAHQYFGYNDDDSAAGRDCNHIQGHVAAEHLTLGQASFIAGIPQNPNINDPTKPDGFAHALLRQAEVLRQMVAQHRITQKESDAAWAQSHTVNFLTPPPTVENKAPHFVEYVKEQLSQMIDTGQVDFSKNSGLSVYTTLDLPLQQQVQTIMTNHLFGNEHDDYGGYIRNDNASQSAAVIAQQTTGDLRVLLGSWDYYATQTPQGKKVNNKFDVATQGYRQPGSTFKAIDYTTAFSMGWFPAMTLDDVPTIFPNAGGPNGGTYKPLDAERDRYFGELTIRRALQYSMDIPAIKTFDFVGVNNILNSMSRLGMSYEGTPGLASAIGALGVHPIDMVQAYATFANYGRRVPFNAIDHIIDAQGNTIYQYAPPRGEQIFSPQASFLLTSVLTDNKSRIGTNPFGFGYCSPLRLFTNSQDQCQAENPGVDYPAASKTGTTDNLADDWAMGYTMDFTGGVWVGNSNEGDDMHNIDGITGAAPIWNKMMLAAEGCQVLPNITATGCRPTTLFPVPAGVVRAKYSSNGITTEDWFMANNVPTQQGTGNGGPQHVCLTLHNSDSNPWDYCVGPPPPGPGTPGPGATATPHP